MSYAQFKKEVTRFTYIAIICLLPWILSKTPEVLATLIHTFRNPYFGLHIKINSAFEREDYDTVQANIKKFHQWEEKRRQNARVVYTARTAEYYQSLLYEARGDYFQAIELRVAWKGRLYPFRWRDPFDDFFGLPRLLYKANLRKEAFEEFCKTTIATQEMHDYQRFISHHGGDVVPYYPLPRWNSEATLKGAKYFSELLIRNPPNLKNLPNHYVEFDEFIKFVDEEYARLGYPSEYDAAMEIFHMIDDLLRIAKGRTA